MLVSLALNLSPIRESLRTTGNCTTLRSVHLVDVCVFRTGHRAGWRGREGEQCMASDWLKEVQIQLKETVVGTFRCIYLLRVYIHSNEDLIRCVKIGVYMGFRVPRGS